jgi:pimeloyl-ACP methyl ester carboxylesterase
MNPRVRNGLIATLAVAAGTVAGVAGERYLVRRARSQPDPDRDEPLAERPGEERRVASFDGTELAVNLAGSKDGAARPSLVFVHGFTVDMTAWHFQWKRFVRDHRCVLYDQRGHGRSSPAADGDYSLEALGRDLRAVLDAAVGPGPAVLIGHSMGGMAILSLAALHPEEFGGRVQGVVLANTAAADILREMVGNLGMRLGGLVFPALRRLGGNHQLAYRLRQRAVGRGTDLAFLLARATNFGPHAPPSMVDYLVSVAARTPPEVWTDIMASIVDMDLGHALEHVAVPTLLVAGDVDRLTPPATARAMKRRLPDARMVVFKEAGHCVMLERHEQFNGTIEEFLVQLDERRMEMAPA